MTPPGVLRSTGCLRLRLQHQISVGTFMVAQFFRVVIFISLFVPFPAVRGDPAEHRLNATVSGATAGANEPAASFEAEGAGDASYVFKPSPIFWRPLASLPASSFPPYDLGHHAEPPYRLIFASCNRQPEGKLRWLRGVAPACEAMTREK